MQQCNSGRSIGLGLQFSYLVDNQHPVARGAKQLHVAKEVRSSEAGVDLVNSTEGAYLTDPLPHFPTLTISSPNSSDALRSYMYT